MTAVVTRISVAPVKGLRLVHPPEIDLGIDGVAENRRFYLVDEEGARYGLLRDGRLQLVEPSYDAASERLELRFPDGSTAAGKVELGATVTTDFYGRPVRGRVASGPWGDAVSAFVGRPLRLVRAEGDGAGVDRGDGGSVSLVSQASLDELARHGRRDAVDDRRFRMLFLVSGCDAHEEDRWIGRRVEVGEAVVELRAAVGRCAITTQDPSTGVRDFDTLRTIKDYRGQNPATRELDFGVYGRVVEPGRVRVGDRVEPIELSLLDRVSASRS